MILYNQKKTYKDLLLNTIAIGLPIATLQLFIYPNLVKVLGNDKYGLLISVYSIWILISGPLSNSLSSVKLINHEKYKKENLSGDYPIISTKWAIFVSIVVFAMIWIYIGKFRIINIILGTISAIMIYYETYYECSFRIEANFLNILICKTILAIGYIIGYLLFLKTKYWELIFIFGYSLSFLFIYLKSNFRKEKHIKTRIYKSTLQKCNYLAISNFINDLSTYADKLIIYPLMGGNSVTIYYTSMLLGKVISLIANSLRDVILSYISKNTNNEKINTKVFIFLFFSMVICYLTVIYISNVAIGLLYPQLIGDVIKYLPFASAISILDVFGTILYPFTLRYSEAKWQVLISILFTTTNYISCIILWRLYGLMGFYIGALIGQLSRILMFLYVYYEKSDV